MKLTTLAALGLVILLGAAAPAAAQDHDPKAAADHTERVEMLKQKIATAVRDHDEVALRRSHQRLQWEYERYEGLLRAQRATATSDTNPS